MNDSQMIYDLIDDTLTLNFYFLKHFRNGRSSVTLTHLSMCVSITFMLWRFRHCTQSVSKTLVSPLSFASWWTLSHPSCQRPFLRTPRLWLNILGLLSPVPPTFFYLFGLRPSSFSYHTIKTTTTDRHSTLLVYKTSLPLLINS